MPRRSECARSNPARSAGHSGRDRFPPGSTAPNAWGGRTTAPVRRPAPCRWLHSPAAPAPSPRGPRSARIAGGPMVDPSFCSLRPAGGAAEHTAGLAVERLGLHGGGVDADPLRLHAVDVLDEILRVGIVILGFQFAALDVIVGLHPGGRRPGRAQY